MTWRKRSSYRGHVRFNTFISSIHHSTVQTPHFLLSLLVLRSPSLVLRLGTSQLSNPPTDTDTHLDSLCPMCLCQPRFFFFVKIRHGLQLLL